MTGFDTISSLLGKGKSGAGDDSPGAKLAAKQKELDLKKLEQQIEGRATAAGVGYLNLTNFPISPEAIALIAEDEAKQKETVCFFYDGDNIRIGTTKIDMAEAKVITEALDKKYFTKSKLYLISPESFKVALEAYRSVPIIKKYDSGVEITSADLKKFEDVISNYRNLAEKVNEVNITDLITLILATAMKTGASDIHIEAEAKGVVIRLRLDGVLHEAAEIAKDKWHRIISRLKILAGVKINVDDKPQDGRYTIFLDKDKIDVRVSFLPTAYGESVVMRLLKSGAVGVPFEGLGMRPEYLKTLNEQISRPNGLILTTGPTGSGKTTTLYSMLNKLNKPGTKIITLEDPIEYQLQGISQSQVDSKAGYSFASGLRSILRQDPNVVMVGEIRDLETAEIAVQASLTGHLVLSTLHTNDASGVIPRLIDIGVQPYFLIPSLNVVLGQRLVRKLCPKCRAEHNLEAPEVEQVQKILGVISPRAEIQIPAVLPTLYKAGAGCDYCSGTGYKDRIGIYEMFVPDDKIKQLMADKAPAFKILQQAMENGMLTMLQDGVLKVLEGITSLEEIYRVSGDFSYIDELYAVGVSGLFNRGAKLNQKDLDDAKALWIKRDSLQEMASKTSSKDIINLILALAVAANAGDLHIEPTEADVKIRFRIDGLLYDIFSLSSEHYYPVLGEFKIMCGLATNVKHPTFDGRFTISTPAEKVDCRVSIISGSYGETIVTRLLFGQNQALDLENIGLNPWDLRNVQAAIKKTKGIIVTTGPTGSGKTTTLYSVLKKLNTPDVKIITVEDPIEYRLSGVLQTQVDNEQGYTFAAALRSLLRQNPNIMMIGEIRDEETAKIAIEASLTGHLVLSTIHANSAAGAVSRFSGLGVDRKILANALECTIGQRLVRRLCPKCKTEVALEPKVLAEVQESLKNINNPDIKLPATWKFMTAKGCPDCGGLGYKGRLGLYEVIMANPEMQKAVQDANLNDSDIEILAVKEGTITILQDGLLKALAGETTVDEVFRVCR